MKKLFILLLTVVVTACGVVFAGCDDNVKNGSKIQRVKLTLDIYDASGAVTDTTDCYMELYLNFAPESTAHIIKLVEEGYYDGTCVSNINSNWMEIGGYKYNEEGLLTAIEYPYESVIGEFLNNGLQGNRLSTTKGAVVFKRDYDDNTLDTDESKYDTAKSTMAICFSSSANSTFNSNSYCILGRMADDDANSEAETELEQKSSIDKLSSLTEYKEVTDENENTVVTYYYEKTGAYYTKWTDEESAVHYAEGSVVDEDAELTGAALEAFNDLFDDNSNYFLVVPSVKLVIRSMSLA